MKLIYNIIKKIMHLRGIENTHAKNQKAILNSCPGICPENPLWHNNVCTYIGLQTGQYLSSLKDWEVNIERTVIRIWMLF